MLCQYNYDYYELLVSNQIEIEQLQAMPADFPVYGQAILGSNPKIRIAPNDVPADNAAVLYEEIYHHHQCGGNAVDLEIEARIRTAGWLDENQLFDQITKSGESYWTLEFGRRRYLEAQGGNREAASAYWHRQKQTTLFFMISECYDENVIYDTGNWCGR